MYFAGKKVLVIGGTGTIGRSIVRSILKENPKLIRIFSRDEFKQIQFQTELNQPKNVECMIGDIRFYERLLEAMNDIDYVFHLAALKHVDICEKNPYEAVMTNIYGMNNVIQAAIDQRVRKVVFTSTDKAVSPTNAYGATKLIAERLISTTERLNHQTIFASVRFGNVMGSRGSVIPLFKEQILQKQKISVTDMNMTRFMMTISQATELTINALKKAKGGEIFVLKMPVVRLGTLVDILIDELSNQYSFKKENIVTEMTGLRPGEKMYEELMTVDESKRAWELSDMFVLTDKIYHQGQKANVGTYRSDNEKVLDRNELYRLLKNASLI